MQIENGIPESVFYFRLGIGFAAGIIVFLFGLVAWFVVHKIAEYDSNCERTNQNTVDIALIKADCTVCKKRRK